MRPFVPVLVLLAACNGKGEVSVDDSDGTTIDPAPITGDTDTPPTGDTDVPTTDTANDAPLAEDDAYVGDQNEPLIVEPAAGVLANDTDPEGDALVAAIISPTAGGVLLFDGDGSFEYHPDPDFLGVDTFTYVASDGVSDSAPALVTIEVVEVNDSPEAVPDAFAVPKDTTLATSAANGVLANDSDPDGDPLTATVLVAPANGALTLNSDGSFIYVPDAGYEGTDSFEYEVSDGTSVASSTATIAVGNAPAAPVVGDDAYSTSVDQPLSVNAPGVLANDSDPNGDPITAVLETAPANGSVALGIDGSFTYSPALGFSGSDSFTYHATDGALDSGPATVTVEVGGNAPPTANDDSYTHNGWVVPLNVAAPGVLDNDTDPDGDPLSASVVSPPANGTLTLNADGSFNYKPDAFFTGIDTFTYEAFDGADSSTAATVTIDVQ